MRTDPAGQFNSEPTFSVAGLRVKPSSLHTAFTACQCLAPTGPSEDLGQLRRGAASSGHRRRSLVRFQGQVLGHGPKGNRGRRSRNRKGDSDLSGTRNSRNRRAQLKRSCRSPLRAVLGGLRRVVFTPRFSRVPRSVLPANNTGLPTPHPEKCF